MTLIRCEDAEQLFLGLAECRVQFREPPLSARIAQAKAAGAALFHRDGTELRRLQESLPAFFAQVDKVAGVPIMAGAGSQLIRRGAPSSVTSR